MGIYIPGMEAPKDCCECRLCNGLANTDYGVCAWCNVDGKARDAHTMQGCPLVPVPPHGRLGDLDAFESIKYELPRGQKAFNRGFHSGVQYVQRLIMAAPTIIPAEEGEI